MSPETPNERAWPVPPEERRRYLRIRKRVRLKCHVVAGPEESFDVSTENLSMDGLLLTTRKPLAPGTVIQLRATVEGEDVELAVKGRVVWTETHGATGLQESGICLLGLDDAQRRNFLTLTGKQGAANVVEQRHYIRLKKKLLVRYRVARPLFSRWRYGETENLSVAGLALQLVDALPLSSVLVLKLHLDDPPEELRLDGQVVGCTALKEGHFQAVANVRFQNLGEDARQRLAAYVSKRLAIQPPDSHGAEPQDETAPE